MTEDNKNENLTEEMNQIEEINNLKSRLKELTRHERSRRHHLRKKWSIIFTIFAFILLLDLIATSFLTSRLVGSLNTQVGKQSFVVEVAGAIPTKYTLYVGLSDKDTKTQLVETKQAKELITAICDKYSETYTMQNATGAWKGEDGTQYSENTIMCIFDGEDLDVIHQIADEIIEEMNLSSIFIESTSVHTEYYTGTQAADSDAVTE